MNNNERPTITELYDFVDSHLTAEQGIVAYTVLQISHAVGFLISQGYTDEEIAELAVYASRKGRESAEKVAELLKLPRS